MPKIFIKSIKKPKSEAKKVIIFEFLSSENLFFCIENLYKNKITRNITGDLYKYKNIYRLVLFIKEAEFSVLSRFLGLSDKILYDSLSLAQTHEYAKIITTKNSINLIGSALEKFTKTKDSLFP